MSREPTFDHEKLDVYRLAIELARFTGELMDGPLSSCTAKSLEHLNESSRSVARNIAEGNGKRSKQDRCRFLETLEAKRMMRARASLCELANAHFKNRFGHDQILVRGAAKVTCVTLLGCLAFNLLQHASTLLA